MNEQTTLVASALAEADIRAETEEDTEHLFRIHLMVELQRAHGGTEDFRTDHLVKAIRNAIVHESRFAQRLLDSGIQLDLEDLFQIIDQAIAGARGSAVLAPPQSQFTEEEERELARGGFESLEPLPEREDPAARTAAGFVALLATALTTEAAADLLGVKESRIRQRLQARTLYGVKRGRAWRLPRFQFTDSGTVPGIDVVLSRLAQDLHPMAVWRWITSPAPELVVDDIVVSPRDWLCSGGDPERAAELAAAL